MLQEEVLAILRRMEKLKYTEWLWLPDVARKEGVAFNSGDKARARFRDLLAMEARGMREYVCAGGAMILRR